MPRKLSDEEIARAKGDGCLFPVRIMETAEANRYRALYEDVESRKGTDVPEILSVKPHVLFRWLYELGTTPTLLDAIEDLVGPNIMMPTCAIWAKGANDPRFVTWHQDSAYFGYEPMDVWGAWIALTDSHSDNGCLKYLPGSHHNPEMAHEETWDKMNMLSRGQRITDDFDDSGQVNAELEPGECSIHHFRLAHASEPNLSDRRRIGILFVYCAAYVRPTLDGQAAMLVRGENAHDYWLADPMPERDLDPANLAYYNDFWANYVDPQTRSEAERRTAGGAK